MRTTTPRHEDVRLNKSIRFGNQDDVRTLFGARDKNLKRLRDVLHIEVLMRGDELQLQGARDALELGSEVLRELKSIIRRTGMLADEDFDLVLERCRSSRETQRMALPGTAIDVCHKDRHVKALTAGQEDYIAAVKQHDLVICSGPAGSGKTYLAVALAVNALRKELVRKIVLVRPAVEAGEKLGFLPGDMFEKVNPYLKPLLDALQDILDQETVRRYLEKEVVEIVPLAFMRGRTLNNTFIILDEAQNTTVTQMKMFLTRMGHHSKIVVNGDMTQVDLPEHVPSGLADAVNRLTGVPGVKTIGLQCVDIVRHPLVRRIVAAYDVQRNVDAPDARLAPQWEAPAHTPDVNGHTANVSQSEGVVADHGE